MDVKRRVRSLAGDRRIAIWLLMTRFLTPCLIIGLAAAAGSVSADPRNDGRRCTADAVQAGANWKGTYSGTAPSDVSPRGWSGERCFRSQQTCRAWLNRIAGLYSYSTRTSRCERL